MLIKSILNIIYPVRCPICKEIVIPKGSKICRSCKDKLHYIGEPRCMKCSKPIEQEEKEYCNDCEHKKYHFTKGFSVWVYDDAMKHSIADFKYHSRKENADFYIDEMVSLYGGQIEKIKPDVIVPVPVHRSKYLERGYNQADILACGIGKRLNIPVLSHLLVRSRKTLPQKQLSDKERLQNLQQAFSYNEKAVRKFPGGVRSVLLVDDIYTTGSTIEACTNVLLGNGVIKVFFITICIGKGF